MCRSKLRSPGHWSQVAQGVPHVDQYSEQPNDQGVVYALEAKLADDDADSFSTSQNIERFSLGSSFSIEHVNCEEERRSTPLSGLLDLYGGAIKQKAANRLQGFPNRLDESKVCLFVDRQDFRSNTHSFWPVDSTLVLIY